ALLLLREEADGDRYHREHARRKEREKSKRNSEPEERQQAALLRLPDLPVNLVHRGRGGAGPARPGSRRPRARRLRRHVGVRLLVVRPCGAGRDGEGDRDLDGGRWAALRLVAGLIADGYGGLLSALRIGGYRHR